MWWTLTILFILDSLQQVVWGRDVAHCLLLSSSFTYRPLLFSLFPSLFEYPSLLFLRRLFAATAIILSSAQGMISLTEKVSKMFGFRVDKNERWHSGDAEEVDQWLICFVGETHKRIFRLTAYAHMTKEQRVKVTSGALCTYRKPLVTHFLFFFKGWGHLFFHLWCSLNEAQEQTKGGEKRGWQPH